MQNLMQVLKILFADSHEKNCFRYRISVGDIVRRPQIGEG